MKTPTYTPTYNPSKKVDGNQQNIYDINIQRQELDKWIIIENTLKCKPKSQQTTSTSWLVTNIKAIMTTPIQKFEKPIFLFRRTHEAAVRNRKILAALTCDLGVAIAAHKDIQVNYESEFRDIASLAELFLHHEETIKIINIIQQGYR